jgi:hypothetical protein
MHNDKVKSPFTQSVMGLAHDTHQAKRPAASDRAKLQSC